MDPSALPVQTAERPQSYVCVSSPSPHLEQAALTRGAQFICSPTDFHAGKPELIAAVPPGNPDEACHFVFEWRSHVACPTNRKSELETGHYIAFGSMYALPAHS